MERQALSSTHRILLVDDDELVRRALQRAFVPLPPSSPSDPTFEVEEFAGGREALAAVEAGLRSGTPFKVVFVDYRMPEWNGVDTLEALWGADPSLNAVLCSGVNELDWQGIRRRLGRPDRLLILRKPFANEEAFQMALALSERWELERAAGVERLELERLSAERAAALETERQALEVSRQKVQHSEERYRALYDGSLDCVYLHDFEGNFLDANNAALELLGYDRSEILQLNFQTLLGEDQLETALAVLTELQAHGRQKTPAEFRLRRKDGTDVHVEASAALIYRDGAPHAVLGIARDQTARRSSQETLRLLQKAMDTTQSGITIKDRHNRIRYVNPAEARMHGYRIDELVGRSSGVFGVPEARDPMGVDEIRSMVGWARETENLRKDGSRFPVSIISDVVKDDDGEPIGVVTVCEDITERRMAEAAMQRSEANLRSLVERFPDAVAVHRAGTIAYVNPTMVTYLDYDSAEGLLGRPVADIIHPEHYPVIAGSDGAGLDASNEPAVLPQARMLRRDGQVLTAEVIFLPIVFDNEPASMLVARDVTEILTLRRTLERERSFRGIVGADRAMRAVYSLARQAAPTAASILITGETGTGKELLAQAIHLESDRAAAPFVPVNCGALPEGLIESELFGHVRGAFTGAVRDKRGRFEIAHRGTIFLDEIGELAPVLQVKLLRVLQEHSIQRVGDESPIPADARVIAATNRDLQEAIRRGSFREDLYFRLCVVPIHVPPLRERRTDIPILVDHFLAAAVEKSGRRTPTVSAEARRALVEWDWPGNVRELMNAIEYALVRCGGRSIELRDLPAQVGRVEPAVPASRGGRRRKLTRAEVHDAMREAGGNKAKAARILGVGRPTLYRYLAEMV